MIKEIFSQFLINLIKILSKYKSLETILLTWSIKVLLCDIYGKNHFNFDPSKADI